MKRFALVGLIVAGSWIPLAQPIWADDPVVEPAVESAEPAIINHPTTGWELTKSFVGYVEPGADWLVAFNESQEGPLQGFSGAVYTFENGGFPLASVRLGYGLSDPVSYGTLALDLPGLAGRFIPASVKGLSPGAVNGALAFASKFVRIGPSVGYNWSSNTPVYGVSIGAALTTSF